MVAISHAMTGRRFTRLRMATKQKLFWVRTGLATRTELPSFNRTDGDLRPDLGMCRLRSFSPKEGTSFGTKGQMASLKG
jgi:hypothetical protein